MEFLTIFYWGLVILGHTALSCVLFNLIHANASPNGSNLFARKITEKLIFAIAIAPLICLAVIGLRQGLKVDALPGWLKFYATIASVMGVYFIVRWCYRTVTHRLPLGARLISASTEDVQAQFSESLYAGFKGRIFAQLPFNQSTQLSMENWEFIFPELPESLDGLRVCQLSDLHFTGVIKRTYFEYLIDKVQTLTPDLILITGDIIDESRCLDWINELLGQLSAPHGVYYVLGNHDLLIDDQQDLRRRLQDAGLIQANNGQWHRIKIGTATLMLAGNELPWYPGAEELVSLASATVPQFSILLSHSPDQIGWAVQRQVDLVFAGHTHGGQIRLPLVGPIIAPSRYGIKYASGTFQTRKTLMHVSRGISGDEPIRINCPPELGIFKLVRQPSPVSKLA